MDAVFEHVKEVRYLLLHLLEIGFTSATSLEPELRECGRKACELALAGGARMLAGLADSLGAFRAGRGDMGDAATAYSNLISYYRMISAMLIVETLSTDERAES